MLKKIVTLFLMFALLFGMGACKRAYKPGELAPDIVVGDTYYTQFSLFQEDNEYETTNYRRGFLIPINTPATLVSIDRNHILLRLPETGQPLTIENVQRHTGDDSQQAFRKILGKRPVDLSRFNREDRRNILNGSVSQGMNRKATLAAMGYPPQTATPSLESNEWTYWSSRHDRFVVRFSDNKVVEIQN